jgi:transcriptional regulator with XRE-family HTH domain
LSNFYKRYTDLCAANGYTPSGAAAAIGLSNAAANGWKKGKVPSDVNLSKLASLFGCSVEFLKGEKEKPTIVSDDELSDSKRDMINLLCSLSPEEFEKKEAALRAILDL